MNDTIIKYVYYCNECGQYFESLSDDETSCSSCESGDIILSYTEIE